MRQLQGMAVAYIESWPSATVMGLAGLFIPTTRCSELRWSAQAYFLGLINHRCFSSCHTPAHLLTSGPFAVLSSRRAAYVIFMEQTNVA